MAILNYFAGPGDIPNPTALITSPTSGAIISGTVTAQATATDNVSVTRVEFYYDSTHLIGTDTTATGNSYSVSWDTTSGVSDGDHTLIAKAYDAANNVGTSLPMTITVDNTPPTSSITSPAVGSFLRGTVAITATAADTNGIQKVEFRIDSILKAADATVPYLYSWDTATSANGTHTISAIAYDNPGNTSIVTETVTVDNAAPTEPTGLVAVAISSTQIGLTWNASIDSTSGIAGYDVYRGGTKINSSLLTTPSYNDAGLTPATSYSYHVKAIDKAGNISASSTTASATTKKIADINGDRSVDIFDLSMLLSKWGSSDIAADWRR